MTKDLSYLFGIVITIFIGIFLYFTLCSSCHVAAVQETPPQPQDLKSNVLAPTSFPFAIAHEDFNFKSPDNFNFNLSSGDFELPVSFDVNKGVEQLKIYLSEHPDKAITITGLYLSSEENSTAWPNLGLARATMVKNYLVGLGVPSAQTNTVGKLAEELVPQENSLLGPVHYDLVENEENPNDLQILRQKILENPLMLYFETGEAEIRLTASKRAKVADIVKYLDKADGTSCTVVGHTDDTGQRAANIQLGQERADFVKAFLIKNGIPESKITSSSKGPDDPITSNTSEAGRKKNRRTVVTVN
ncbi:MAG: OmpA family protein [Bacteroidota bacterium]